MNNQEKFAKLFLEFEDETKKRTQYNYEKLDDAIRAMKYRRYNPYVREDSFIEFCRRLRNISSHNLNDNYYLITDETINKLETIIDEVKHPFKVVDKATNKIYSKTINDKVLDTMLDMNKKSYTHIPIYSTDNNKLLGVFSENSLFQYIIENEMVRIDNNTSFKDIAECIDIRKSKEIVKFVSKDKLYDDVINDFIKEFKEGNKLSCIMVTEHGSQEEKVIGIITSWDIIGR